VAEHKKVDSLRLGKKILERGSRVRISIVGSSMYPLLRKGDNIFIEPTDAKKASVGDILVCQRGEKMYAHRLMKKYVNNGKTILVTKGDSFSEFDAPLYSQDVLGKVTAIERKGRYIRINNGLYGAINLFCARLSLFSKWIYPILRQIKHRINRIKNRYADRNPISALSGKTKY